MAEPLERNSLELHMAFHNAVSRFQDWTANVAEPKVRLHGRFRPISEVCEEVANLSNLLARVHSFYFIQGNYATHGTAPGRGCCPGLRPGGPF
jgi:hypothetical protein